LTSRKECVTDRSIKKRRRPLGFLPGYFRARDISESALIAGNAQAEERARATERGFALLLVIWVLALLAVLAAEVAAYSHSAAIVARNRVDGARSRAVADAGIAFAIVGLLDPDLQTRWRADGRTREVTYDGETIIVRIEDEGGKIDLNNAPIELIAGLAEECGATVDERMALATGIADRRHASAAASSIRPSQARFAFRGDDFGMNLARWAFAEISEVKLLPGMSRALYDCLRPYITVYPQSPTINPMTAARATLLAIPGIGEQDVDVFLATRRALPVDAPPPPLAGLGRYARLAAIRAVTISAQVTISGRARFKRSAAVLMSPDLPLQPIRMLE
jgi:general secretion pathway protein K